MDTSDKALIKAKDGPAPQYYNPNTGSFEILTGRDGANSFIEKGRVVKDVFANNKSVTKTYTTPMSGFGIVNDGIADLTFAINGIEIVVKQNEAWDDLFDPFTTVAINATDAFRAVVRE